MAAPQIDASQAQIASQAEAEAGTISTKLMTPQRTSQAISALAASDIVLDLTGKTITLLGDETASSTADFTYTITPGTYGSIIAFKTTNLRPATDGGALTWYLSNDAGTTYWLWVALQSVGNDSGHGGLRDSITVTYVPPVGLITDIYNGGTATSWNAYFSQSIAWTREYQASASTSGQYTYGNLQTRNPYVTTAVPDATAMDRFKLAMNTGNMADGGVKSVIWDLTEDEEKAGGYEKYFPLAHVYGLANYQLFKNMETVEAAIDAAS